MKHLRQWSVLYQDVTATSAALRKAFASSTDVAQLIAGTGGPGLSTAESGLGGTGKDALGAARTARIDQVQTAPRGDAINLNYNVGAELEFGMMGVVSVAELAGGVHSP